MEFKSDRLHVFLDLEQTLVESWDAPWRVNQCQAFRDLLVKIQTDFPNAEFHMFSFAIWDVNDVLTFEGFKENIENSFNIKISNIPTRDNVLRAVKSVRKLQILDGDEMSQLFGKSDSWLDFCKCHNITDAILFDDLVNNMFSTFLWNDIGFTLRTLKVNFV